MFGVLRRESFERMLHGEKVVKKFLSFNLFILLVFMETWAAGVLNLIKSVTSSL